MQPSDGSLPSGNAYKLFIVPKLGALSHLVGLFGDTKSNKSTELILVREGGLSWPTVTMYTAYRPI